MFHDFYSEYICIRRKVILQANYAGTEPVAASTLNHNEIDNDDFVADLKVTSSRNL